MGNLVMRPVADYPGYEVTSNGMVYSDRSQRFLKPSRQANGYLSVEMVGANGRKRVLVHRIVAKAFIPNPDSLPQVNHINERKDDNRVENLEWVTPRQNIRHGTCIARRMAHTDYTTEKRKQTALEMSRRTWRPTKNVDTGEIFRNAMEAARAYGISHSNICECGNGHRKSAGGYRWAFI